MKGLSRVWGNLHARFLWGRGSVMGLGYQTSYFILDGSAIVLPAIMNEPLPR
jgi:hypothetical protein